MSVQRMKIAWLGAIGLLVASCSNIDEARECDGGTVPVVITREKSPDGVWEIIVGGQNWAGGFGTGSYAQSVFLQRIKPGGSKFKIIEISEDKNGDDIGLTGAWPSSKHLSVSYRNGNIDWQVVKSAGVSIDLTKTRETELSQTSSRAAFMGPGFRRGYVGT